MKNIFCKFFLSVALGLIFVSCLDYLDMEKDIKDRMTIEEVFSTKDYTEQWLANAYSYLGGANADMGYGDECPFSFSDDIYHSSYNSFTEQTFLEGQWQTSWQNCYLGIRQATIFIQHVDQCLQLTEAARADYKAQARFIRAFYYWKLLQKYGPVPLIPEEGQDYTKDYEKLYVPRNSYDECVEFISSEMKEAARFLPAQRDWFSIARPTRGAALSIRARALLYAASPLMNGNQDAYAAELVDNTGKRLLAAEYSEEKWAVAAAAAKDVMDLGVYDLYTANRRVTATNGYPVTIPPYKDGDFSEKNWPDGYADIDPFESYRSIFNGELTAAQNPELIFTRGQNQSGIRNMVLEQLPTFAKGNNKVSMTQKQCDAYYMSDGKDCPGKDSEIGRGDGSVRLKGFVTAADVKAGLYKPLIEGVSLQYANREPRFYASVAYNGAVWALQNATLSADRGPYACWYYHAGAERYSGWSNGGLCTGIGMMKFVRPTDTNDNQKGIGDDSHITEKADAAVRYAEILLIYAEALNELKSSYEISSWDGSRTYTIARMEKELKKGIRPIRIRAGIPDYDESVYSSPEKFREKLKRERQIELMGEGHRYFDLRRWKDARAEESLPIYGCNTKMTEDEAAQFHHPVVISEIQTRFTERTYFWPISISELYRNRKLTQNPGWQNGN